MQMIRISLPALASTLFAITIVFGGCSVSYLVDPIPTPVFTEAGHFEGCGGITADGYVSFQAACSLPADLIVLGSYAPISGWHPSLQRGTTVGIGHFWPRFDPESPNITHVWTLLGGYGWGDHEFDSGYSRNTIVTPEPALHHPGSMRFRRVFLAGYLAILPRSGGSSLYQWSYGLAGRIEYLDRFWTSDLDIQEINTPQQTIISDFGMFGSIGIRYVQIWGEFLLHGSPTVGNEPGAAVQSATGIRVSL